MTSGRCLFRSDKQDIGLFRSSDSLLSVHLTCFESQLAKLSQIWQVFENLVKIRGAGSSKVDAEWIEYGGMV